MNSMTASTNMIREAKSLWANGHPEESISYFTRAAAEGCNPVTVYLSRGAAYLSLAKFQEAIEDFTSVLEIDTDNERALYYRGVARMNLSRFEEAVEDLDRAIGMNRERGASFLARGVALAELGRDEEATRDFKTASLRSEQSVESFLNQFGSDRTMFGKSQALLEGDRGPWKFVMTEEAAGNLDSWLE